MGVDAMIFLHSALNVREVVMTLETGSCPIASINICKDCAMVSSRSLGMHRHHRHPVEVNQERITEERIDKGRG